jgi:hypothetical protein
MGTGNNTFTAANTQITVVIHNLPGTVIAHLGGAYRDAAVAVHTFIFQHLNNRPKGSFSLHNQILYKNSIIIQRNQ